VEPGKKQRKKKTKVSKARVKPQTIGIAAATRGVIRLDDAQGKKQVWRPRGQTGIPMVEVWHPHGRT